MSGGGISQQQLQQAVASLNNGFYNYPFGRQSNQVKPSGPIMQPLGGQFQAQGQGNMYQNMFRQMVANQPAVPMQNPYAQTAGMYPYRPPVIGTPAPAQMPAGVSVPTERSIIDILQAIS